MPSRSFSLETVNRRREECERKARRGEMDPRLEYTFQLLIDGTGLSRHEIMDHVFEGNMLDEINQLFIPHAKTKLMWFYQDMEEEVEVPVDVNKPGTSRTLQTSVSRTHNTVTKKKLFLTDGWEYPLTGICIYIFRINTTKQLPEEGFHKDLYCGVIDAERIGLVTAVERIIRHVFMEALAFPISVCEEVCGKPNIFDDGRTLVSGLNVEQLKELAKQPDEVEFLQNRVKNWMKYLSDTLKESDQIRRENDSSGPQDELEYWKKRGATFSQIVNQLQVQEVQFTIMCLQFARSKVMKEWRETDQKITFCYNEAKDNAKFIQALEKNCHSLYLDDPVKMKDSILGLLQTVRLIHSVSQFYNTSERTSALMVKITNQMIETCKEYVTCRGNETIWSQDRALVKEKLTQCIVLNQIYRRTYHTVKSQPFIPDQMPFNFSENYVFGKFNAFCNRLGKIIAMFDIIDDFSELFKKRMEGLLLGETLDEAVLSFNEAEGIIVNKPYDYLDQRNAEFDNDFQSFLARLEDLKKEIANIIELNYENVWETPQGIKFLSKFEKVKEKIPLTNMDNKYERILKYCEKEVSRIVTMYKKEKDDPPVCRMFPPIAGRIKWARSLVYHLSELMENVTDHPILKTLPAAVELTKRYKNAEAMLKGYEKDMVEIWMSQHVKLTIFLSQLDDGLDVFRRREFALDDSPSLTPSVAVALLVGLKYFVRAPVMAAFLPDMVPRTQLALPRIVYGTRNGKPICRANGEGEFGHKNSPFFIAVSTTEFGTAQTRDRCRSEVKEYRDGTKNTALPICPEEFRCIWHTANGPIVERGEGAIRVTAHRERTICRQLYVKEFVYGDRVHVTDCKKRVV
ncbi:dynein heavy chain 5, axonemal-like [Photinus pyralis]|uniref:dynein heavy chain 5, axonemal-like n=1 Tax=Photinus pyralis TaxID=7054 RepID=UPI0012670845|nr:dynein heavy chain 5, axonemal-like [Photinus pyralis]